MLSGHQRTFVRHSGVLSSARSFAVVPPYWSKPGTGKKVAVLGSGSFGTAMAAVAARNGFDVSVLTRRDHVAEFINKENRNPEYLSDFTLPSNLRATTVAAEATDGASMIIHSVPIQASFDFLKGLKKEIPEHVPIVCTSKGLHVDTLHMMKDVIPAALDRDQPTAFFSGPTFAKELMMEYPSGAVVASSSSKIASQIQHGLTSQSLRIYTTTDVVGVEVGGALKNVYAIAAGVVAGLGLQYNTTALLCTRAIAEMNQIAVAMGSTAPTLAGLAGIGDLMLTCFGSLSRNRMVGERLGRGETIEAILGSMSEAAEGVATTPAAHQLAQELDIQAPIIRAVNQLLQGEIVAAQAIMDMMARPVEHEVIFDPSDFQENSPNRVARDAARAAKGGPKAKASPTKQEGGKQEAKGGPKAKASPTKQEGGKQEAKEDVAT